MNTRNLKTLLYGTSFVILAAGVTYACKDFLNNPAQGTLDQQVLSSKSGVEGSLIAAYRALDCSYSTQTVGWGCAASNWVWGSVPSDEAYKGSNLGDQQPINDVETFVWSVGDVQDYLNEKWSTVYEGVSRANATIRLLDEVLNTKPGEISASDADGIRGEAIFLRAHYQFEAYRMWGNIPYYRADNTDYRTANEDTLAVVRDLLIDLDSAIALLPPTPRNGQVGRADSWTARAYKGRVEAYAAGREPAYWDSALVTLRDVATNGPFHLETSFDHVWTAFPQYQNGPETILAYQASVRDGEPNGENSNFGERLNFPHSGSHFGCCGFHQPSQNLVNFFAVNDSGLPLALTDAGWNTAPPASRDTNLAGGILTPVDPRLDWTVGRDKVPYKDWGLHDRSWIRDASYSGPYSPKKNVDEQAADGENNVGWVPTQTNDVNIHIYRAADMLLLLAEAEVERGALENARAIVNSIRARAGQIAQGCGSADSVLVATYPTCSGDTRMAVPMAQGTSVDSLLTPWATYRVGLYTTPWTDQTFARRAVRYERRLELAMEGQRFFDLRRWGTADTVINNYIASEQVRRQYLSLAAPFTARHYLYPIPALQIELSRVGAEDRLKQNPGW